MHTAEPRTPVALDADVLGDLPYAGDVSPQDAWSVLSADPSARLIDVRTPAEWSQVGVPLLLALGKEPVYLPWRLPPANTVNPQFVPQLIEALGEIPADTPVFFLCRSGGRSLDAAIAATAAGYARCYNVADGFEGAAGWKALHLPWGPQ